jgi:predicted nucleic acid-binding Zn ribbon protein
VSRRWRRGDSDDGGMRGGDPTRLGDALGAFLRKHGLDEEVAGQEAVERWAEVVGERIAAAARPTGMARGVLYVEVRSSAWMSELSTMRREILSRLNAGRKEGRVERIVFRLGEDPPHAGDPGGAESGR